jgi:hypothetical protein
VSLRELVPGPYFRVLIDDDARVVRIVRTELGFPSLSAIEDTFAEMELALAGVRGAWSLLIDAREGPMRNDPAFEETLAKVRGRIVSRFARTAVLVKSAVGKLQVARYAREDRMSPVVFTDEAEALAHLAAGGARAETR